MEGLFHSLRHAIRSLRKRPGFSLVVILTLAFGIGANTAIFSVVHAVLLSPLPYGEPDKLVVLWAKNEKQNLTQQPIAYPNIVDLKQENRVFEHLSAIRGESLSLTDRDEPERVVGVRVSTNILSLLEVSPVLGRSFLPEEEQPAHADVALVGYGLWQRRYAGDPHLIGQTIPLDGRNYTVVGILPAWLKYPGLTLANLPSGADVWIPVVPAASEQNRNFANEVVGVVASARLTSLEAQADPAIYIPFPQNTWPNALRNSFIVIRSSSDPQGLIPAVRRELRAIDPVLPIAQIRTMDEIVGDSLAQRRFNTTLLALFAFLAAALAAVGIYGVMSYTVTQRTREVGIRMALGARRSDITLLVTGTGARLALLGVALGVVAAVISTQLLSGLLFGVSATDPMTFVLTALVLGSVTMLASYIPSRRAAGTDPITALRSD